MASEMRIVTSLEQVEKKRNEKKQRLQKLIIGCFFEKGNEEVEAGRSGVKGEII